MDKLWYAHNLCGRVVICELSGRVPIRIRTGYVDGGVVGVQVMWTGCADALWNVNEFRETSYDMWASYAG